MPPQVAPTSPPAATVTLTIESTPDHALVRSDGVLIGATPMMLRIPVGETVSTFEVSADGYEPRRLRFTPRADQRLVATLRRPPPRRPAHVPRTGLPDAQTLAKVRRDLQRLGPAVQRCGRGKRGSVVVDVTIDGSSGRVVRALARGTVDGVPLRGALQRAWVRGTRVRGTDEGMCVVRTFQRMRVRHIGDREVTIRRLRFALR